MEPNWDDYLSLRERPNERPVMLQSWRDLLFMHQRVDPALIRPLITAELELDLWEGTAWLGLVPFWMKSIRRPGLPAAPWLSAFPETNVRTYVRYKGRPGVWFFSLDAARLPACIFARKFFSLPYHWAFMSAKRTGDELRYESDRRSKVSAICSIQASRQNGFQPAEVGSFDFWLVERYLLYAYRNGRLFEGQVYHQPYEIAPATVSHCQQTLTTPFAPRGEWEHICYSPGVDVEVFPLKLA